MTGKKFSSIYILIENLNKFLQKNRSHSNHIFVDGDLLFNQVPLLKIDGMNLVQTNAILNYVATKTGLNGKDAKEKAM